MQDNEWTLGKIASGVAKGAVILFVLYLGFSAWKDPEVRREISSWMDGKSESQNPASNGQEPARDKPLEIEVREDVSDGCKLDPSAMGCPLKVVKVVNKGQQIHLKRIVFNRRIDNPDCDIKLEKQLNLGDVWSSETAHTAKSLFAYSFTENCGTELIYVDLLTDHGSAEYSFKNGG